MHARRIHGTQARRGAAVQGRRRPRRLGAASAVAAAVVLAGCADVDGVGSPTTPDPSGDPAGEVVAADLPLLQIERSGGFVLMGTDFASVPELTVYADGEAIAHGPQILIYPPPALPNLVRHDLSDADVEALIAAAREAGLLDAAGDYGQPPVADAPTTFVTLRVDGREFVHSAEALGIGDGAAPAEPVPATTEGTTEGTDEGADAGTDDALPDEPRPGDELLPGLTEDERSARAELAAFIARAHELVGTSGEGEPYPLDAFAVMARPAPTPEPGDAPPETPSAEDQDAAGTVPAPDDGLQREVLPWPLDLPLADAEQCVLVDGDDAGTLREAVAGTSSATLYEQGGVRYDVWLRPLLPHEDGCDDVV
ncbi:hypothetical protein [uncultured Cellulomonas sp.]|uniref:hypothetical protein n=1 Tax=uncultured Cellulomonas sp. TaxID=189682 RepID=UPI0026160CF8|nr:hypothetical protein [uncultured Cellulomonas sp.]